MAGVLGGSRVGGGVRVYLRMSGVYMCACACMCICTYEKCVYVCVCMCACAYGYVYLCARARPLTCCTSGG